MRRAILHCDLNCFFASVEMLYHPEFRNVPMAIAGDKENRHGIILAKNPLAKRKGVKTAEPIFKARNKCPGLVIRDPDYKSYGYFSDRVRKLFLEYTDKVEPFGIDEAWLDITESIHYFGSVEKIVNELLNRCRDEIGLTLSIGVSYNKPYAKIGSDIAKEDSFFIIDSPKTIENLKASCMIGVGEKTYRTLQEYGLFTMKDIMLESDEKLERILGKGGKIIRRMASGEDESPVASFFEEKEEFKSVSCSVTNSKDITNFDELKTVLQALCDNVSSKIRKEHMFFKTVHLNLRDCNLKKSTLQITLKENSDLSKDIYQSALQLFTMHCSFEKPYRSVGVAVNNLSHIKDARELSIFEESSSYDVKEKIREETIEKLRNRFGSSIIGNLRSFENRELSLSSLHEMKTENGELYDMQYKKKVC